MKGQYLRLDRNPGLLVAQQLRYQREIHPIACAGRSAGDFRDQLIPQRPKIDPVERHPCEPGKSNAIGGHSPHDVVSLIEFGIHASFPVLFVDLQSKAEFDFCGHHRGVAKLALQNPARHSRSTQIRSCIASVPANKGQPPPATEASHATWLDIGPTATIKLSGTVTPAPAAWISVTKP
jgi:hypothetical protein